MAHRRKGVSSRGSQSGSATAKETSSPSLPRRPPPVHGNVLGALQAQRRSGRSTVDSSHLKNRLYQLSNEAPSTAFLEAGAVPKRSSKKPSDGSLSWRSMESVHGKTGDKDRPSSQRSTLPAIASASSRPFSVLGRHGSHPADSALKKKSYKTHVSGNRRKVQDDIHPGAGMQRLAGYSKSASLLHTRRGAAKKHVMALPDPISQATLSLSRKKVLSNVKKLSQEKSVVRKEEEKRPQEEEFESDSEEELDAEEADRRRVEREAAKLAQREREEEEKRAERRLARRRRPEKDIHDRTSPFWFLHMIRERSKESLEFVYLRPVQHTQAESFNPYHLKIVPHAAVSPNDFYTMSSKGVTHFVNHVAEFTSLEQWEREHDLFEQIIQIPLFHQYRMWKGFFVWRKNVSRRKMRVCEQVLQQNLFLLNDNLRGALLHVRNKCHELGKMRLFFVEPQRTYSLDEFCDEQARHKESVLSTLASFMSSLRDTVWEACDNSLQGAGFTEDDGEGGFPVSQFLGAMDGVGSTQKKMSYTDLAAKRTECRRLTNFIKLVDYLIINTLHMLTLDSVRDFLKILDPLRSPEDNKIELLASLDELRGPKDVSLAAGLDLEEDKKTKRKHLPLLSVRLCLDNSDFVFDPTPDEFHELTDAITAGFVNMVMTVEKLVTHNLFRAYTQPTLNDVLEITEIGDGADLRPIIEDDTRYQSLLLDMREALTAAFSRATTYCRTFSPYSDMFLDNKKMDIEGIRERNPPLEWFQNSVEEYRRQIEKMKEMPILSIVGIVLVDSRDMKNEFIPSPRLCLRKLEELLPQLAKVRNDNLLGELNDGVRRLNQTPYTVEEFVEYLSFLDKIDDRQDELQEEFNAVHKMYDLMDKYKMHVQPEDFALYQTLMPTFNTMKASIAFSDAGKDEGIVKFSEELEQRIAKLHRSAMELRQLGSHQMIDNPASDIEEVLEYLGRLTKQMEELKAQAQRFNEYRVIFHQKPVQFQEVHDASTDLRLKNMLWGCLKEWGVLTLEWNSAQFNSIDADDISNQVHKFSKSIFQIERGLPNNRVVPRLKDMVHSFKQILPVVMDLRNPALKPRHWDKIQDVIRGTQGQRLVKDETFTLGLLLDLHVTDFREEISEISLEATNEAALEEMLRKVESNWAAMEFQVVPHRESKELFIVTGVDDVIALLEDSQVTVAAIRNSRYIGPIRDHVENWDRQLSLFAETLEEWMACQRSWMYLESIFSAPDIQRQLPTEAKMFVQVDKSWRELMRRTKESPNALRAATTVGVLEMLKQSNVAQDQIQKALEEYLETKRLAFPRFYFLSNDELLEILAQTRNPLAVQPHLRKCFDNINELEFDTSSKTAEIQAMLSTEGERVQLGKNLKARGGVELWLGFVEQSMVVSLRKLMKLAVQEYPKTQREKWVVQHPSQVVLAIAQVYYANEIADALNSTDPIGNCKAYLDRINKQLSALTALVRGSLTRLQRGTIGALLTIDVHNRDVLEDIIRTRVQSSGEFGWTKRLRYYWDTDEEDLIIRQLGASFAYGYEYLGCTPRLVITPLTDRCYITLTTALRFHLGGAPAGPAGTGKTETVKDLAKAMAKQCMVFNCSEGLNHEMMGKFFSGLAQCGAWCCFDEFNRLDIEVLSVVAQQILTIRTALSREVDTFEFEGHKISLNPTCGFFITMNPGYAGRTELPDNLKSLFRSVAMMIPDYALIAEIILFSEGFESAKVLSRKATQMYKLSSEQLSQQYHYDFGMRALKSVMVMAGSLKRAHPDLREDIVLIRSLRDSNIPKFLDEDIPLFQGIIRDLFPGIELPAHDYGVLVPAIEDALDGLGMQRIPRQIKKIIQLYQTMEVRHGVMLVGPTAGGKTTVMRALQGALTRLHAQGERCNLVETVKTYVVNPKSVKMGELFGEINEVSHEWNDGLVASIVRSIVADEGNRERKWVVFDGPVDSLWIENMNTVLDDNKMLCLSNGQRIKLNSTMHMMFEVQDLAEASPATVSRCGMVYIEPCDLGWQPYVDSWVEHVLPVEEFPVAVKAHIRALFEAHIDQGLDYVNTKGVELVPSVDFARVVSVCRIFRALCTPERGVDTTSMKEMDLNRVCEVLFAFSYIWGVGGSLTTSTQDEFDRLVREQFEGDITFPPSKIVFDYFVDVETLIFRPWSEIVAEFKFSTDARFFEMVVPTVDTVRYSYLLDALLAAGEPTLLTGETGTGKSIIISKLLNDLKEDGKIANIFINFSARTTSRRTQETIEVKLEKRRRNLLGGPGGQKVALFVDDINMPALDRYGSQPPIELLRQLVDCGGFYDRKKLFWKDVVDVTLVAACAPPGGGRNNVTPRLFRHFTQLCVPQPSVVTLKSMFGAMVTGFLTSTSGFIAEVQSRSKALVNASVDLYGTMCTEMLPTPENSHYTFNLRDLSKVIQGLLQATPNAVPDVGHLTRLWVHESMRVFHDRLSNAVDKGKIKDMLISLLKRHFDISWDRKEMDSKSFLWGDFMLGTNAVQEERQYEEIVDLARLRRVLEDFLDDYNFAVPGKEMKLVFFQDALEHVVRIARIVRMTRGNALLVGVGGCGKQSLTRLASTIAGHTLIQVELKRQYGIVEFREDLKNLYVTAGVGGKSVTFLMTDNEIVQETFLEDISNILNSGEVPNLFELDEYEKIINDCMPFAKAAGIPEQRDLVYAYFIERVRNNLHIVLCMSPVGSTFRTRCRMFPSLVNCCTIDWFNEWPEDALLSVSRYFLEGVDLGNEPVRESVAQMCVSIHQGVRKITERFYQELRRRYYTTPTSYLDLIKSYIKTLGDRRQQLNNRLNRLRDGLKKLQETDALVRDMEQDLAAMEPELVTKAKETEELLVRLEEDQHKAEKLREVVVAQEMEVKEQTEEAEELAAGAQRELDEVLPQLEDAIAALDTLDKASIATMKSYKRPPDPVEVVMQGVCILCQVTPDWPTSQALLGDAQLLKKLANYDKDHIPSGIIRKLGKLMDNVLFDPERVATASTAAAGMCRWARAMYQYHLVFKVVEPKRIQLEEARSVLEEKQRQLQEKQDQLAQVEAQLSALHSRYERSLAEKQSLAEKIDDTRKRLRRAEKLTTALADEQIRWADQAKDIEEQISLLVGDVFLGSACMSYLGAFTGPYRQELVGAWLKEALERKIPVSEQFDVIRTLSDPVEVRDWSIVQHLPTDRVSVENGIIVTRGSRWPLMIDPQSQANRWIRNLERHNPDRPADLKIIKASEKNMLRSLENAIRIGQPVLLEEVGETLDPALDPIIRKATFRQGGQLYIRVGDHDILFDSNWKLYITTKLANPHYLPDVCIKVNIINFTVTYKGLEDQLLGDVVRKERPELEEQKDGLVMSMAADKKQLKSLEDKILRLMYQSEGNLLDDELLINTLNESKITSGVIQQRVKQSEETEIEINATRERYRSVAQRGSLLYFVITDMALIEKMYQFSLKYFVGVFNDVIETSEKSSDLGTRLDILLDAITWHTYVGVSRGLFARDQGIFSFLVCVQILRARGEVSAEDWDFFLRGTGVMEISGFADPPDAWISPKMWKLVCGLSVRVSEFKALPKSIAENVSAWKAWIDADEPWREPLPGVWDRNLTRFQRLLLLKCLRESALPKAITDFISQNLGKRFTEPSEFNLEASYANTSSSKPLVFILTTGADPTSHLLRFAEVKGYGDRMHIISLGQGQGPVAEAAVEKARKTGEWVFLQNCHLAESWMPSLAMIVEGLGETDADVHPDFRLWLSSMPAKHFPVPVLQNSIKVTNEPPKGLKNNLLRSYMTLTEDQLRSGPEDKMVPWHRLLFGLCFFNGVIQERKKFGPIGWNILYEFNDSDWEVSVSLLNMFLTEYKEIPWEAMLYLIGDIACGGRVTDDWDRRCMHHIVRQYLDPSVLEEGCKFSRSGVYYPPNETTLDGYQKYLRSLPASEQPEVFGMDDNADMTYQLNESRRLIEAVLTVQPRVVDSGGSSEDGVETPGQVVTAICQDFLSKLPALLDLSQAHESLFAGGAPSLEHPEISEVEEDEEAEEPVEEEKNKVVVLEDDMEAVRVDSLSTVLSQEAKRYNRLLLIMREKLEEMIKAIKGLVVMSEELELMFFAIFDNQVPARWKELGFLSMKPLASWFKDLQQRVAFMQKWLMCGHPTSYWLPGFFFPQGFLTGTLQNHARKYNIPIDTLSFSYYVTKYTEKTLPEHPEDGVYVHGLQLEGARWDWDHRRLDHSLLGEIFTSMPVIHFRPTMNYVPNPADYSCPLYKTAARRGVLSTTGQSTNFVVGVELPTHVQPSTWVLKGVALLCSLSD